MSSVLAVLLILVVCFAARVGYRAAGRETPLALMIVEGVVLALFLGALIALTL